MPTYTMRMLMQSDQCALECSLIGSRRYDNHARTEAAGVGIAMET